MSRTKIVLAALIASGFAFATASAADAALFNNRNVLSLGKEFAGKQGFSSYATVSSELKGNIKTYSAGSSLFGASVVTTGKLDTAKAAKFSNATNGATTLSEGLKSRSAVFGVSK